MPTETGTQYLPRTGQGSKFDKPPQYGDPSSGGRMTGGDDFNRIAAMLERIRQALRQLVFLTPAVLPAELQTRFAESWPLADQSFTDSIAILNDEERRAELAPLLERAGLTGEMLEMKETSLDFHVRRVEEAMQTAANQPKAEGGWVRRFVRWIKPAFTVMNSIMGSLTSVIPGIDVAKEYKEHVEAGYEVVETATDRE
jgi:hypothetical protein